MAIDATESRVVEAPAERDVLGDLVATGHRLRQDSAPEELIAWGEDLAQHEQDPRFTAALFHRLGPQVTAGLLRLTTFAADRSQTYAAKMTDTLTAFKTALATASSRLPDAESFAEELARWLLPTELTDREHADLVQHGGLPLSGPSALAQVLCGTSFAQPFLDGLAARVRHFEESGAVDPVGYYRQMTPARFDDYRARDIAGLIDEQRRSGGR
jgi:hypothetical protein